MNLTRARRGRLGHRAGRAAPPARTTRAVGARRGAGGADALACGATSATCPRSRCPPALQVDADFDAALRACARRPDRSSPRRWRRCDEMLRRLAARRRPVLWLCKGFEEGSGCARPRDRARGARPDAARRRAVGPELRARGGARPADRAGRRERRRGAVRRRRSRRCTATACASTRRRPGRRRGRRRGEERAGDRHRHRRRHGSWA